MNNQEPIKAHIYISTDYEAFSEAVANRKDIWPHVSRIADTQDDEILRRINTAEDIKKYGINKCLKMAEVKTEAILATGVAESEIETYLKIFIDYLGSTNKLVIIDPYILKEKDANTLFRIKSIFTYLDSRANEVHIVTIKDEANSIKAEIISHSNVKPIRYNGEFHDRFWISLDNKKGFVVGTSINGIGNRYSLIDYLSDDDVMELSNIIGVKFSLSA